MRLQEGVGNYSARLRSRRLMRLNPSRARGSSGRQGETREQNGDKFDTKKACLQRGETPEGFLGGH